MLRAENFKKSQDFSFINIEDIPDSEATEYSTIFNIPVAYF